MYALNLYLILETLLGELTKESDIKESKTDLDINVLRTEQQLQENLLESRVRQYERAVHKYLTVEKYERELYIPPGIKLERRWFRFPLINPIGLAYRALFKIELDERLNGSFYQFVGEHELYHIVNANGFDETKTRKGGELNYQIKTGKNETFL